VAHGVEDRWTHPQALVASPELQWRHPGSKIHRLKLSSSIRGNRINRTRSKTYAHTHINHATIETHGLTGTAQVLGRAREGGDTVKRALEVSSCRDAGLHGASLETTARAVAPVVSKEKALEESEGESGESEGTAGGG